MPNDFFNWPVGKDPNVLKDSVTGYLYKISVNNGVLDRAPYLATPKNVQATSDSKVYLTWDAVETAVSYTVKRATNPSGPFTTVASDITSVRYTDGAVSPATTYYYTICAVNPVVTSADSDKNAIRVWSFGASSGQTPVGNYTRAVASRTFHDLGLRTSFNISGASMPMDTATNVSFRSSHHMSSGQDEIAFAYLAPPNMTENKTLKAAFEYDSLDTIVPITFGGSRDGVLKPGQILQSDWVKIPRRVSAREKFFARTMVTIAAAGQSVPTNGSCHNWYGEGVVVGTDAVDSGSPTLFGVGTGGSGQSFNILSPIAVIARNQPASVVSVIGIGDSIMRGSNDGPTVAGGMDRATLGYMGYLIRNRWAFLNQGRINETAAGYMGDSDATRRMMVQTGWYSDAVMEYSSNDIANGLSAAQVKADISAIFTLLKANNVRITYGTMTPRNSAGWDASKTAVRTAINDWIRAKCDGQVDFVFDAAAVVETSINSNTYANAAHVAADAIHPTVSGHVAIGFSADLSTNFGPVAPSDTPYPAATTVFADNFNRGGVLTSVLGNTSTGGKPWNVISTDSVQTAVFEIVDSGQLRATGGFGTGAQALAYADAGTADGYIQAEMAVSGTDQSVFARMSDNANYYSIQIAAATITLRKKVAGTATTLGTVYTNPANYIAGDVFGISVKGSTIKAFFNGLEVISATDSALTSGTNFGVGSRGMQWDNVVCKAI